MHIGLRGTDCVPVASENYIASVPNLLSDLRGSHSDNFVKYAGNSIWRTFRDINLTSSKDTDRGGYLRPHYPWSCGQGLRLLQKKDHRADSANYFLFLLRPFTKYTCA